MAFADLDEFFDDALRLPIGGKEYVIPSPDAATGLHVQRLFAAAEGAGADTADLDDEAEADLYRRVLGGVYDEMVANGLPWSRLRMAGLTALVWVAGGVESAEAFWAAGGRPEAPGPNRASRRAGSGSAPRTRRPGSTAGTTPPPRAAVDRRSAGGSSSAAGG